jgi:hypothetical protein
MAGTLPAAAPGESTWAAAPPGLEQTTVLRASPVDRAGASAVNLVEDIATHLVIDEFCLQKADPKVKKRLTLAKMLPFTDGPSQAEALKQELLA